MPQIASSGKCELCGKSYRKSGMTRHLRSCMAEASRGDEPGHRARGIHLHVEDTDRPEYWLHLAVPATAELLDLDQYLRDIWLECCLHLSSFAIGGINYFCPDYFFPLLVDDEDGDDPLAGLAQMIALLREDEEREMDVPLGQVAHSRSRFRHEYDFGTTTELTLRGLGEVDGDVDQIRLLARNDPPAVECSICGAPATWVSLAEDDWIAMTAGLCDACAPASEYRLPIVNSPRCGVCAYDGIPLQIVEDDDSN